ncbi:MAG TPA: hypothetical protein VJR89_03650 [Polyangiales bacterium]|nr:hypothetical protein [Polyangiales bacterium]
MHTVIVLIIGFALLAGCVFVGRYLGGPESRADATLVFVPLWLVGAAVNMLYGVVFAGYPILDESLVFIAVFGAPVAVALVLRRKWLESPT